ncbi:MAG: AMP-binding protein [Chthoniobacterales bacterium]
MNIKRLRNSWDQLPRKKIRALQAQKLRRYLRRIVLPYQDYYREEFLRLGIDWKCIKTLDDLKYLPFSSKKDFTGESDRPRRFIIAPEEEQLAHLPETLFRGIFLGRERTKRSLKEEFQPLLMTSTTGRSSDPVPFVYTMHDIKNLEISGRRVMQMANATSEDRLLNMFPFAPHLAFWQTHYAATAHGIFMLSSGGGKTVGTEGNIKMLRKLQPSVLIGMPTFVYHVLHEAAMDGVRCEKLRCVVMGGEKVATGMRLKLHNLAGELGAPDINVISTYGFTEAKVAWCECLFPSNAESSGYHLYPDLGIVEIIDPETGRVQKDEEPGEIVYTSLDARGTCVLRYRTGDIIDGGLTYEPCPYCGRRMPRLMGNISRRSEIREMQFDKIKGTLVDFNVLEHLLDDLPDLGAWQIEIRKLHDDPLEVDELILHLSVAEGVDEEKVSDRIKRHVFEHTELRPNRVEFHTNAEIRKLQGVGTLLKEQKVADNRSRALATHVPDGGAA